MASIIFGLDLGTRCGWAVLDEDGTRRASGTWDLRPHRHAGAGMRYVMLEAHLNKLRETYGPDGLLLAYEECVALRGDPSRVYNSMLGVVQAACERWNIPYRGIPVATVKRTATGKGNANKEMMIEAARKRWWPVSEPVGIDDNEADALLTAESLRIELYP